MFHAWNICGSQAPAISATIRYLLRGQSRPERGIGGLRSPAPWPFRGPSLGLLGLLLIYGVVVIILRMAWNYRKAIPQTAKRISPAIVKPTRLRIEPPDQRFARLNWLRANSCDGGHILRFSDPRHSSDTSRRSTIIVRKPIRGVERHSELKECCFHQMTCLGWLFSLGRTLV
jgi:hypothetical protein